MLHSLTLFVVLLMFFTVQIQTTVVTLTTQQRVSEDVERVIVEGLASPPRE